MGNARFDYMNCIQRISNGALRANGGRLQPFSLFTQPRFFRTFVLFILQPLRIMRVIEDNTPRLFHGSRF